MVKKKGHSWKWLLLAFGIMFFIPDPTDLILGIGTLLQLTALIASIFQFKHDQGG